MVLDKLRKSLSQRGDFHEFGKEEYIEVDVGAGAAVAVSKAAGDKGKIGIVIETLSDFNETERVLRFVREGNVVFLKIKGLREKDLGELKRAVERLKRTVIAQNGDIVGVEQDWLLLVPEHVAVHR